MTPREKWEATQKANGLGITWEEHIAQMEQDHSRMIPLHIADQAVANCESEITRLRESIYQLNIKGQAMAGYLQALAAMPEIRDGGELQRLMLKAVAEWDETAAKDGWKPLNR
jgi:hypothetical protein